MGSITIADYMPSIDLVAEARDRAFVAMMAYEKNCILKYDRDNSPSRPIPKKDQQEAFAIKHRTTVKEMRECLPDVERLMNRSK